MTVLWAGLSTGAIYVLAAIGYNVVFVTAGVFNFAQAQFMMIGTFVAYWVSAQLRLPVAVGFAFGAAIGAAIGLISERVAIRPVRGLGTHTELVTTVGVGIALDGLAYLIWGSQPLAVPFFGSSRVLSVISGRTQPLDLVLIAAALVVPLGLAAWSRWSLAGLASRAIAEDRQAASARGIPVARFGTIAVTAAAAFAGMLGPLVGPETYAVYTLGDQLAITAFVALAIGGFGSYVGAMVGGLAVGLIQAEGARYLNANYGDLLVFGVLLAVLMIRPAGLLRSAYSRAV
jgi:branched-chain amino acid transport system permease protein